MNSGALTHLQQLPKSSCGYLVFFPPRKPDGAFAFGFGWGHEFSDGIEDDLKLGIVFLLQLREPSGEGSVAGKHLSEPDKSPYDFDIDLNSTVAAQYAREHRDTLFGERIGQSSPAPSAWL